MQMPDPIRSIQSRPATWAPAAVANKCGTLAVNTTRHIGLIAVACRAFAQQATGYAASSDTTAMLGATQHHLGNGRMPQAVRSAPTPQSCQSSSASSVSHCCWSTFLSCGVDQGCSFTSAHSTGLPKFLCTQRSKASSSSLHAF
jgi:hypothetical protein